MALNVSRRLTTIGGDVTRVGFMELPPNNMTEAGTGARYIVQRRDDFGNPVTYGNTILNLSIPETEQAVHSASWFIKTTSGNPTEPAVPPGFRYGFRNEVSYVSQISIPDGILSGVTPNSNTASFYYRDTMSSWPIEDGRSSTWTVTVGYLPNVANSLHALKVNPKPISRIKFDNPRRRLIAGEPVDPDSGQPVNFETELRDMYDNPSPATSTVAMKLSMPGHVDSLYYPAAQFSVSSMTTTDDQPVFQSSTDTLLMETGQFYTTFYYLDTRASVGYGASSGTMPTIRAEVPVYSAWEPGTQSVEVVSRDIYRMGLANPERTLTAGATSQIFVLEVQDKYGNAAIQPLSMDRMFDIESDSTGTVLFASPYSTSTPTGNPSPSGLRLLGGSSSVDFYVVDTLAKISTLTITTSGLDTIQQAYTVEHGQPVKVIVTTPQHRLVAGTTIQYVVTDNRGTPGDPADDIRSETATVITLELKDLYGNAASTDVPTQLYFGSAQSLRIGEFPNEPLVTGQKWTQLDLLSGSKQLDINQYDSVKDVYVWDTVSGTDTLTIAAAIGDYPLDGMALDTIITPAQAAYFTIHHTFTNASPLKVTEDTKSLTVKVRDRFGNVARGDVQNGQYYTGRINFSVSSSSASVTNKENNPPTNISGTTFYTFSPVNDADPGVYSLLGIRADLMTDSLKVNVTDYATASLPNNDPAKIFGHEKQ